MYQNYKTRHCFKSILFLFLCSSVSGPTTWLMFATPVRGLVLSEIWGLFIQICEILCKSGIASSLRQMSPSSYFPVFVSNVEHYILREQIFFPFHAQKFRSFVGSRTRFSRFVVRCSSTALAGPGKSILILSTNRLTEQPRPAAVKKHPLATRVKTSNVSPETLGNHNI